jgi:hypothetical protein
VKVEELSQKVRDLQHEIQNQKHDSELITKKYEAMLKDANRSLESLQNANPDQLTAIKLEHAKKIEEFTAYIVELETKLEWYLENQDISNDIQRRIDRYEKSIHDLQSLDVFKTKKFKDAKKIELLQNQILDLQEDAKLSSKNTPDIANLVQNSKPIISPEDIIKHLKGRSIFLETESQKLKLESSKTIHILQEKVCIH